jgi:hypothetical protein
VAETTHGLITNEDFNAFEVALDRQTWPDGGMVLPASKRQLVAIRAAMEQAAPEWRARWVAEALEQLAGEPGPVNRVAAVLLLETADEYRAA